MTALLAAALCLVAPHFASPAAALPGLPSITGSGLPGVPLNLVEGSVQLPTGLVTANLSNGANGPVLLTVGPCIPLLGTPCSGVLSEFALIGSFKDAAGHPLYSDAHPASVSWTCNALTCPPPADAATGTRTISQLQVEEFLAHTMYVAPRNPDGTFQAFAPAPACHGTTGAPLPTGTIDQAATGGREFCVDVGAISRANPSSWSGPLTMPILFVEDPKFMGT